VEAVDPALLLCSVTGEGDSGQMVRRAWEQISASLQLSLDQITVGSMASSQGDPMFYI
jgi:DNA-binding IscR family transcriptional regulator